MNAFHRKIKYKCPQCDQLFTVKQNVRKHLRKFHQCFDSAREGIILTVQEDESSSYTLTVPLSEHLSSVKNRLDNGTTFG
jgi:hypothetical protein